ncbi:MAG: helix-turn-helix transcriptional regulator [Candidatus Hodarchaeota archaeon]
MQSRLIGPDRRGGRNYREVSCSVCGDSLFVSKEAESGICARCVVMGYSGPKVDINIRDLRKSFEKKSLKEFRRKNKLSQTEIAKALEISERHYRNLEKGQPISRSINRKIEKKLAQVEQGH